MATRILYAEDTVDLSRAVCAVLQHEGYEVTACFDGEEASQALADGVFDVVVLDIMMPQKNGIEVLRDMRASGDVTPVILLTAKTEVDDRVEGLDAGADDYLSKPFAMKELTARIRSLARRNTDYGTGDLRFGNLELKSDTYELRARNSVRLSHAEFELLRTFVLNAGRVLHGDFLSERVWGADGGGDAAVELYVRYLRDKLEAVGADALVTSSDGGYVLVQSTDAAVPSGENGAAS